MASVTQDSPTVSTAPGPVPSTSSPEKKSLLHSLVTRAGRSFASWSIEQRVLAGFGLVFAGIVVISIASYRNTTVLIKNSRLDTRSHEFMQLLGSIGEALDEAERGHRRYLVTGDKAYLKGHKAILEQMPAFSQYMRGLTEGAPDQEARVVSLEQLIGQQLDAEAAAIAERQTNGYEGVRSIALSGAARLELEAIHRLIVELETAEQKALRTRVVQSAGSTRNTIALLVLGALLQLVLLASVYHLIHHDITERRRVATELRHRGELLQAANKELEAFSYSVSHDLRAPLRHIDGYASLLSKTAGDSLNDKARRYLQTISDSAKQMGQLIDDLLVFSRMGRQEMLRTGVNLDQLVKTVIHDLRHDLQGRAISWTIGPLPEVYGDPAMLRQVFTNLLSNALKFTRHRAGAKIEIGATLRTEGETEIFVRDNGAGFDMQYVNKLFGVFQRLHRHDEFEGTGIGLANVRRIIHRHGGRTRAEGAVDRGATFFFTLPTKRVVG
jgi:signal transduction histidine kinase